MSDGLIPAARVERREICRGVELLLGDCREGLALVPTASVQCVVTSPPYWGLRDYGIEGVDWPEVEYSPMPGLPPLRIPAQRSVLGLEETPEAFIAHLVEVFRALRRVLRPDGVAWLNLGDCFVSDRKWGGATTGKHVQWLHGDTNIGRARRFTGLPAKSLCGIPWRAAFALQGDGWTLRSDIVWAKRNAMPESIIDRPTRAHELVFLLAQSERYFYDAASIAEPL